MLSLALADLDEVKLDPQPVGTLWSDARRCAFVPRAIDSRSRPRDAVVAKDVEDVVTRDLLARPGSDVGPSHFFARPTCADPGSESRRSTDSCMGRLTH